MEPSRRGGGRPQNRSAHLSPWVQRLLDNVAAYELRAELDDGHCIYEVVHVQARQPGAGSALHAKWQEEGSVTDLAPEECSALARAGYKINKDSGGYWVWWREQRLSHLWLVLGSDGWMTTRAQHPRGARWKVIGNLLEPVLPMFEGYTVSPQTLVREGLVAALMALKEDLPMGLPQDKFFAVAKMLCDEAVYNMTKDDEWFNSILSNVPVVDVRPQEPEDEQQASS